MLQVLAGLLLFNVGAILVFEQFERTLHAYGIASSAMEPALHCARPDVGCTANTKDRVLVARFHPFWTPKRGDVVVFDAPESAKVRCGAGGSFVKRLIVLPGETWEQRQGVVYIDGKRLIETYVSPELRGRDSLGARQVPDDR